MPQQIVFAQVLQQLMDERYRRNRAALAEAAHVSQSAISQYVRGRATPSLDVLVQLADILDVSLDYLVFGQERSAPPPELGFVTGHLEAHMRSLEEQNASLHDLVVRIGAKLAAAVKSTAEELLPNAANIGGTLSPTDVSRLERCASVTTIFTADLSKEILVLERDGDDDVAAPSVFAEVVAQNISEGGKYEYIVPKGTKWTMPARLLRQEIIRLGGLEPAYVDRHLHIHYVSSSCIPGYVVQHLELEKFRRQAGDIMERVTRFLYSDPYDESKGYMAYSEMVNTSSQHFDLIPRDNIPPVLEEIRAHRRNAGLPGNKSDRTR